MADGRNKTLIELLKGARSPRENNFGGDPQVECVWELKGFN